MMSRLTYNKLLRIMKTKNGDRGRIRELYVIRRAEEFHMLRYTDMTYSSTGLTSIVDPLNLK